MTQACLASQFYVVGDSIGSKISSDKKAKTVFITTPIKYKFFKESELGWHYKNRETLKRNGFITEDYDITGKTEQDLVNDLSKYEVMYVEGGNPFSTLKIAQTNNFCSYVRTRIKEGMIYVSESAGTVLAGADIAANGRPGKSAKEYGMTDTTGIGLINSVIIPHWGQEAKKEDHLTYKIPQAFSPEHPCILLTDYNYLEIDDTNINIIDIRDNL